MQRARGFTLIELLTVVTITAILLAVVVPSFNDLLERRRVEGVVNELSADLQYTRSESVSRRQNVALSTAAGGTIYTVTDLSGPTLLKTVTLPANMTVTPSITLTYTALRGIPNETAGGDVVINVTSTRTPGSLRVVNNFMGRLQMCSPDGTFRGHTPC